MFENIQSHRRLLAAMGVSSLAIAALLGLLTILRGDAVCSDAWCVDESEVLTVHLVQKTPERISEIAPPDYELRPVSPVRESDAKPQSVPIEQAERVAIRNDDKEKLADRNSERDWHTIAKVSARQDVEDRFSQEESRKAMWRETGSVMFRDTGEFDFHEPATIIAKREFRIPVGVLGIGITIGGCFFGIPLVGIPVEQRSVGPTIIYCPDIYE